MIEVIAWKLLHIKFIQI